MMRYFVAENGLIASINDDGTCNLPVIANNSCKAKIGTNFVELIGADGEVIEQYQLWDSLTELATAIES